MLKITQLVLVVLLVFLMTISVLLLAWPTSLLQYMPSVTRGTPPVLRRERGEWNSSFSSSPWGLREYSCSSCSSSLSSFCSSKECTMVW